MLKIHFTAIGVTTVLFALAPTLADARPNGVRTTARSNIQGQGAHRANVARPAEVHAGGGRAPNMERRQVNAGRVNTAPVGNRAVNHNERINTGNVRVGNNVNINVDADNGWGWNGDHHPVAAGVAFGTAAAVTSAAVTSAVVGSRYYALPAGCAPYPYSGLTYYSCGGAYYAPRYEGDTVVYVVVDRPG
jgi:hypothetical protein